MSMPKEHDTVRRRPHRRSLSIDEVHAKFDGEYVLLAVTRFDERHVPSHGKVLAHSLDPDEVHRAVPSPDAHPGPLYLFEAEPRLRSGPEYEQAIKAFVAHVNARLEATRRGMA